MERESISRARSDVSEAGPGNITRVSLGFVSLYVYRRDSASICVDAGNSVKKVREAFEKHGLRTEDIRAIFLTHSDRDHTGGIEAFPGAKVYMSFDEGEMITRHEPRFFGIIRNKEPKCAMNFLMDKEEIRVGNIIVTCISTPGHTVGSVSYIVDGKHLFVGDALNLKDGRAVMDRRILQMNRRLQEDSIRKLAKLNNIDTLLTAHTGFTEEFDVAMSRWRETPVTTGAD